MSILYRKHDLYPESILIRDFIEKVSVDEIINSWEVLLREGILHPGIKGVLNILSGCDLQMDMESFYVLIEYIKKTERLRKIKLAVVCDTPGKIVFPTLGFVEEKELHIRPFSTTEAAVRWIMCGNELAY